MPHEELLKRLIDSVVEMNAQAAREAAHESLAAGLPAFEAISKGLSRGMKRIGELWNDMEIFMPEVMAAVQAYYAGLEVLRPHIGAQEGKNYVATAVFGTIYGDVHAVGKDVVIPVFQGEDFNVIDLGIDVSAETYVQAVKEHGAHLLGLGTYMSETFLHAREVIEEVKKAGIREQVIILCGGPAADAGVAREMGADGAFRDAWEAVKWAKEAIGDRKLSVEQQIRERTRELAATKEEMRKQAHQLRQVLARSFRTAEEERRRIAVDTHDGVLQLVISSLYEVQALEAIVPEAGPLGEKLRFVQTLLTDAITEMRRVIRNLRPPVLEQAGLEQVLRSYVTSYQEISGLPCSLESNGNSFRLSSERELAIFRIVQEALHNVKKHAEAGHIRISVDFSSEALRVVVADDGTGFDQKAVSADQAGHLGLISMRERAESIGARLGVESAPHRGTKVVVEVPAGEPQAAVEEAALEEKSE